MRRFLKKKNLSWSKLMPVRMSILIWKRRQLIWECTWKMKVKLKRKISLRNKPDMNPWMWTKNLTKLLIKWRKVLRKINLKKRKEKWYLWLPDKLQSARLHFQGNPPPSQQLLLLNLLKLLPPNQCLHRNHLPSLQQNQFRSQESSRDKLQPEEYLPPRNQ